MGATTFTDNPYNKNNFHTCPRSQRSQKTSKMSSKIQTPPTQPPTHTHIHTHTLALKASNIKKLKEDKLTEEVTQRRSVKKMFLENSQNLLENTCAFLNKVAAGTSASL